MILALSKMTRQNNATREEVGSRKLQRRFEMKTNSLRQNQIRR